MHAGYKNIASWKAVNGLVNPFIANLQTYSQHKRVKMPEIKKVKRNPQIFAGCNLHRAVIGPKFDRLCFSIEKHYRTSILHCAIRSLRPNYLRLGPT